MAVASLAAHDLAAQRWRIAITLSIVAFVLYFGFILLVAFDKPLLGALIVPGLSLGMALGAALIVISWLLTWIYVSWANRRHERTVAGLGSRR